MSKQAMKLAENVRLWLEREEPHRTIQDYLHEVNSLEQERDELRAKLAAAETSANELRRAVAELIGADPETWPNHGNAPLAIAACVAVRQAELATIKAQEPVAWTLGEELGFLDKTERCSATMFSFKEPDQAFIPLFLAAGTEPNKQVIEELEQLKAKLADQTKAADHWVDEACKNHNDLVRANEKLAEFLAQKPVAEVLLVDGEKVIDASMAFFDSVELGTKLYLAAGAAPVQQEPDDQIQGPGEDESAFIRWAEKEKYDLSCHPMFFVMLNEKTYAARMGWKAAKAYYGKEAPMQKVFGGRVDQSYVSGPMVEDPKRP